MDKNTFELTDSESAIIFKQDLSTKIILPTMGDEESVSFDEHQNMFVAIAISSLMGDDDFKKLIGAKLDTMFTKIDEDEATCDDDKDPGCGGCQGCG